MQHEYTSNRIFKGNSLIDFPNDFTVLDLETTGLSPSHDEIIEIAAIRIRDWEITDTFDMLVKPYCEISDYISALTGITNAMVENSPSISEVLPLFLNFVGKDIAVGHNVNFDVNFIYDNSERNNDSVRLFGNDYIDTMRIARKLYPELEHYRLSDIVEHLHITVDNFHRALDDCQSTFECFKAMKLDAIERFETVELFRTASMPKRKSVNKFGHVDARTITTQNTEFDTSHPLYEKICVFTGKLEKMSREQAMQIVVDLGGQCANSVTKKTNYLILGNNDYCATIKDGKSSKQKKAEDYKLKGYDIEIMPESVFYDMIQQQ